jgi:choline dehydrogenase
MVEAVLEARRVSRSDAMTAIATDAELSPGPTIGDDDVDALSAWIMRGVDTYNHPTGTCSMGPDPHAGAVVDPCGAVHGVHGLFVADASIMPTIPTAPPNPPTIMIAERIADLLRTGT